MDGGIRRLRANGIDFGYAERGTGPLVLCLHGFPDTYRGFLPILDALAAAGYRGVAPAMRGYAPSGLAPDGDYRIEALADDVLALADALETPRFAIVGHDWGAVAAYAAANLAPARVAALVTAAVPHTGHFLLRPRLAQLRRSHYMFRFQFPRWPERRLPREDFAWIEALIRDWSPAWRFGETELRPLKDNFAEPARLKAALAYYRQLARDVLSPRSRHLVFSPVTVPTRIVYGLQDGCIGAEMFEGQGAHFRGELDLSPIADAGHFMQWEQPAVFARRVIEFLDSHRFA